MKSYTIELVESGMIIKGGIPTSDMAAIEKFAKALGFDRIDTGLALAIHAVMVITSEEGSEKMRAAVTENLKDQSAEDAWFYGWDTGISSKTIFGVMTNHAIERPDVPHDPSDFGRCYRLLKLFPDWIPRLGEVATKYPKWTSLVENWAELTKIYEEELYQKKTIPNLYERIQELLG